MIIQLLKRIKRVVEYIPIIWKTHDWDHGYSLQIYAYSLKRLKKSIENGYGLNREKDARRLQTVICLIERIRNYEELMNSRDRLLDKEFGSSRMVMEPSEDFVGYDTIKEGNPNRNTPEYRARLKQYTREVAKLHKKDYVLLAKYLSKYSDSFWD